MDLWLKVTCEMVNPVFMQKKLNGDYCDFWQYPWDLIRLSTCGTGRGGRVSAHGTKCHPHVIAVSSLCSFLPKRPCPLASGGLSYISCHIGIRVIEARLHALRMRNLDASFYTLCHVALPSSSQCCSLTPEASSDN